MPPAVASKAAAEYRGKRFRHPSRSTRLGIIWRLFELAALTFNPVAHTGKFVSWLEPTIWHSWGGQAGKGTQRLRFTIVCSARAQMLTSGKP